MRGAGLAVGVGVSASVAVVAMAVSLSLQIKPQVVEGPNSKQVLALIRAVDHGDEATVREAIRDVKFTYGELGEKTKQRLAVISDIPGSGNEYCKIDSIRGKGTLVRAHWECHCCDIALDRQFVFDGSKLAEIQNIYTVYG